MAPHRDCRRPHGGDVAVSATELAGRILAACPSSRSYRTADDPGRGPGGRGLCRGLTVFIAVAAAVAWTPFVSPVAGYGGSDAPAVTDVHESHGLASSVWINETADSDGRVGKFSSIAVDDSGAVHVSYYYQSNRDLKYARLEPDGTWTTETVHSEGDVGKYTGIAVTEDGTPHIVYYHESGNDLMYATRDDDSWQTRGVANNVEEYSSSSPIPIADIAVDADGVPHIAYFDQTDGSALKYARWNGISWAIETVEDREPVSYRTGVRHGDDTDLRTQTIDSDVGLFPSIAVDGDRDPHISYFSEEQKDVECWWHEDPVGSVWDDADAARKCALPSRGDVNVKHAEWTGSRWDTDVVSERGVPTDIAIEGGDRPLIAIGDRVLGGTPLPGAHLAERREGSWNVVTVTSESQTGEPLVELDSTGRYHVTYKNPVERDDRPYEDSAQLQYSQKEGSELRNGTCRSCSSGWRTETAIDDETQSRDAFDVSQYSFALGEDGTPHVSYYDEKNGDLKYATKTFSLGGAVTPPREDCAVCNVDDSPRGSTQSLLPGGALDPNVSSSGAAENGSESKRIGVSSGMAPARGSPAEKSAEAVIEPRTTPQTALPGGDGI